MARLAVECFRVQTYQNKWLLVYDNGQDQTWLRDCRENEIHFRLFWNAHRGHLTIGALRNEANGHTDDMPDHADILIHWDSDDWSHPNRIAEQVKLLQSSGADLVGYREMLFWRDTVKLEVRRNVERLVAKFPADALPLPEHLQLRSGEAWLYRNNDPRYCLGTSMCYWRKTWEARPFNPKLPERRGGTGEDHEFQQGLKRVSVLSIGSPVMAEAHPPDQDMPRMIASIHGSNSSDYKGIERYPGSWTRVPEWDVVCMETMSL